MEVGCVRLSAIYDKRLTWLPPHSYTLQWLLSLPIEIVAASEVVGFWNKDLPRAVFVTIFVAFIITINMFGVKVYGEAEYVFAVIKITAVIGFM